MELSQQSLEETRKQTEGQLKGFTGKIRQTVQDKVSFSSAVSMCEWQGPFFDTNLNALIE